MTIKSIAARLAVENGITSKTAERLIMAEANLIKQYHRQLSKISTENIATRRYTESPDTSMIAAASAPLIMTIIQQTEGATPAQIAAVKEYKAAAAAVQQEQEPFDLPKAVNADDFVEVSFSGSLYKERVSQVYMVSKNADLEEVAECGADTVAIRKAVPEIEEAFRRLCRGEITKKEFSAITTEERKKAVDANYSVEYQSDWINPETYDTYGQ